MINVAIFLNCFWLFFFFGNIYCRHLDEYIICKFDVNFIIYTLLVLIKKKGPFVLELSAIGQGKI